MRLISICCGSAMLIAGLSGCRTVERDINAAIASDRAEVDALLETAAAASTAPVNRAEALETVVYPPGAEWLSARAVVGLRDSDPESAVRALAGDYPVMFRLRRPVPAVTVADPHDAVTVLDHLEAVMLQAGWAWRISDGVLVIDDVVTRHIPMRVAAGVRSFGVGVDSLGAGGGGGARNSVSGGGDPYARITAAIEALGFALEMEDGQAPMTYSILDYANTVVLTGPPPAVKEAERLIERVNERFAATAVAEITIFEINFSEGVDRRLELEVLRDKLNEVAGTLVSGERFAAVGSAGVTFTTANPAVASLIGSNATYQWLQEYGTTSTKLHRRVQLSHSEMTTLRDVTVVPYVREVTLSQQAVGVTVSTQPSVQIETASAGYALSIFPTIDADRIALRMHLSRAQVVDQLQYSYGDGQIEGTAPTLDQQDDVIQVRLVSGEVAIVSTAAMTDRRAAAQQTPFLPGLGDSVAAGNRETEYVMVVSAVREGP